MLAEALMPPGVRGLREMMHATAVEVLLYLTPLHCQDMLASLVAAFNAQVSKFSLRNPHFQVRLNPARNSQVFLIFQGPLVPRPCWVLNMQMANIGHHLQDVEA